MLSTLVANRLARRQVHYGWVVAAVTFLTMLVMAGAMGRRGYLSCLWSMNLVGAVRRSPGPWRFVSCCTG